MCYYHAQLVRGYFTAGLVICYRYYILAAQLVYCNPSVVHVYHIVNS